MGRAIAVASSRSKRKKEIMRARGKRGRERRSHWFRELASAPLTVLSVYFDRRGGCNKNRGASPLAYLLSINC